MSNQASFPKLTIGLDLGDKVSRTCELDGAGKIVKTAAVATTTEAIERYFGGRPPCRVVLEVSTHSPWVSRQLEALGHAAVVANTRSSAGVVASAGMTSSTRSSWRGRGGPTSSSCTRSGTVEPKRNRTWRCCTEF